jgi:hypothetical protein
MKQAKPIPIQHTGIVLDLPPEEVDVESWTGGANMTFRDGITERVGGYARFSDPLASPTPLYGQSLVIGADAYWIYFTVNKIYVTNGAVQTDITPVGGLTNTVAGEWSCCLLNGIPCFNNGHNPPMYWDRDTTHKALVLPGWPATARCKSLRATKYHLLALNITDGAINYGNQVWWSAGAQAGAIPQEWTPTASNDAGDVILADTPGVIVDGLGLRDTFMVYKDTSTYVMQYVAGTYVFTARLLFLTTGVLALNCVVEANGMHWMLTGTDVVRHDGQSYVSVVDKKVQKKLIQSIEPLKRSMCCVEGRILNKQVWVAIPEAGQSWLTKAYVIDVNTGDIGIRTLPNVASLAHGIVAGISTAATWDGDSNPWETDMSFWDQQSYDPSQDSLLMFDAVNSHLFNTDVIGTADGQPVHAYIERLGGMFGDFTSHKVVTAVYPRIEGQPGETLMITLGGSAWFNQPIAWGEPQEFVIGTDVCVTDIVEGRLLSVRIEGTTPSVWKVYRYAAVVATQGAF